jgi:putative phage-type endonuclease
MTLAPEIPADPTDPAWHEARRTFIGASDAPAVLGISPWATPLDVWASKLNIGQQFQGNLSTDMGHALEDLIARTWAKQAGRSVAAVGTTVRHRKYPHIAASVDRDVVRIVGQDREHVECKYVGPNTAHQWRNGVPVYVQAQCQVQMAVTGAKRVHVAALIVDYGPQFFTAVIERDDAVIDEIIGRLNQFWAEHIESGARPDTDGLNPDQVRRRLEQMYQPPAEGNPVRLPHELATLVADIKRTKALKRDLEKQIAAAENELRLFMVDNQATDAFIDDNAKPAVTWRTIQRKGYEVAPSEYQKLTVA